MSDADLDARLESLPEDELRRLAVNFATDLSYYRPLDLRRRLAEEVLRLRAELAEARRTPGAETVSGTDPRVLEYLRHRPPKT